MPDDHPRPGPRRRPPRGSRAAALWAALAAACGGAALGPQPSVEYESGRRAAVTADGLYRIKTWRPTNAYLKPGALFTTYRAVVIDPVSVSYARPPRRAPAFDSAEGDFALEPLEMERFEALFRSSLEAELAGSRYFEIVREAAPDALRITPLIDDLVVKVPPERDRDIVYASVIAELTVILDVADSQTGESLARMAGRRRLIPTQGDISGRNVLSRSGDYKWVEFENTFREWGRLLREGLEELATLGPIPAPPTELVAPEAGREGARTRAPGGGSAE
jgi:hypothetical protein